MRYLIIVKASEAGELPNARLLAALADYHEQLARAGVLLDAAGLQPSAQGWRMRCDGTRRQVIDGPFAEVQEPIAGTTLIQVRSRDEALEWTRRFPAPFEGLPCELEVRRLHEREDFGDSAAAERFRALSPTR